MEVWTEFIWLRLRISGRIFWTWQWTFMFQKMLGNSLVAAQLSVSQERLRYIGFRLANSGLPIWTWNCYDSWTFVSLAVLRATFRPCSWRVLISWPGRYTIQHNKGIHWSYPDCLQRNAGQSNEHTYTFFIQKTLLNLGPKPACIHWGFREISQ
jgi:hypothetical protein